ncbi:flagellar basal body rod protein FlgC [Acidimangrovimonas sediminis]|uniref:flagellar basal body rod protein FlgC n=1 Tax=Acidimangrovimonas sediminis TaxID=2056283 RepID=UPI000C80E2F3|nr:flagellar basal body rod protein FlgC [Acidimangrovimonas sediminis]
MSDLLKSLAVSASGMGAQAQRLRHVSENVANADTPGYHRKTVSFAAEMAQGHATGGVMTGPVTLDRSPLERVYDPGNPLADATGHYDGSNVDLVVEIADGREAQRSYDANLKMFDQARQMATSLLDLLRR